MQKVYNFLLTYSREHCHGFAIQVHLRSFSTKVIMRRVLLGDRVCHRRFHLFQTGQPWNIVTSNIVYCSQHCNYYSHMKSRLETENGDESAAFCATHVTVTSLAFILGNIFAVSLAPWQSDSKPPRLCVP